MNSAAALLSEDPSVQSSGAPPPQPWAPRPRQSLPCDSQAQAPDEGPLGQPHEPATSPDCSSQRASIPSTGRSQEDAPGSELADGGSGTASAEGQDTRPEAGEAAEGPGAGAAGTDAAAEGGMREPDVCETEKVAEPAPAAGTPERLSKSPARPEVPRMTLPTTAAAPGPISPFACGA